MSLDGGIPESIECESMLPPRVSAPPSTATSSLDILPRVGGSVSGGDGSPDFESKNENAGGMSTSMSEIWRAIAVE